MTIPAPTSVETTSQRAAVVLRAEDVWKSYDDGSIAVLKGVAFDAVKGETVALCGPSGCGKSTLLHLFGGLDDPDRGRISVNSVEVNRHTSSLRLLRHEVGFVFQLHNLIPDLTLEENCLIPTVAAGVPRATALARLRDLAARTGLSHRLNHRIQKLSGGERQRTALCRALMNQPRILLADEPTGSLDEKTSSIIFDLLLDVVAKEGVTLVMATHDRALAQRCDRLVEMRDGRIYDGRSYDGGIYEPQPV
jgi:ABC-type lipoprotein export system ATPase subunit